MKKLLLITIPLYFLTIGCNKTDTNSPTSSPCSTRSPLFLDVLWRGNIDSSNWITFKSDGNYYEFTYLSGTWSALSDNCNKIQVIENSRSVMATIKNLTADSFTIIEDLTQKSQKFFKFEIIGKPIKIGNLEVAQFDFPNTYSNQDKIFSEFRFLGNGWRLPTKDELNTLYLNKDKIGGFKNDYYWSISTFPGNKYWLQNFTNGSQNQYGNGIDLFFGLAYVRAVRSI
jgi:hypothetical protein